MSLYLSGPSVLHLNDIAVNNMNAPSTISESHILGLKLLHRGKVRDVYEVDDERILLVATDRISAFDCVLPTRNGRHGHAFTRRGPVNLRNARHADDPRPLDEESLWPPARTYARDMVEVRGRVDGYVEQRTFDIGSDVKAGQVLYVLDRRPYQAEVDRARGAQAQAQADLAQAQANLVKAQQDVERLEPLVKEEAAAKQQLDTAVTTLQASRATVEALAKHHGIHYRAGSGRIDEWEFRVDGRLRKALPPAMEIFNDDDLVLQAVLDGRGLGQLAGYQVSEYLRSGRLVACLPQYAPDDRGHYVCYQSRRQLPSRIRVFIDFMIAAIRALDLECGSRLPIGAAAATS